MKKIFRTLLIIIVFVGVWSMYIVKNPDTAISQKILTTLWINLSTNTSAWTGIDLTDCTSYFDGCNTCMVSGGVIGGCTRMFCETPAEPQCLQYAYTGIDLTNCTSYFDGCNNCSVKDGKPDACTLMYCETPAEPKCNQYGSGTENTWNVGLANPASTNCIDKWGTLNMVTSSDGGQVGMCTLKNGTVCEERAYMRGECPVTNGWGQTSPSNPWKACTEEAKICPDGSAVGRTWPNCAFAPCPASAGWTAWTVCTADYTPVCASVAVQCIKAPCPPIEQTFSNKCMMNANKLAKFLYNGECK